MSATNLQAVQIQGITANDLIKQIADEVKSAILKPQPQPQTENLLTRKQVANYLGVSLVTVHNWTKNGVLIAYRIGNQVRYKESEVIQALQSINSN